MLTLFAGALSGSSAAGRESPEKLHKGTTDLITINKACF